ncbi:MAG TPA: YhcH/YjgK/YiaL family protein [Bacteroidales bacterium]|nr:YhcH/YjgK/YiaL family protein [Bacteroidales bacterium]
MILDSLKNAASSFALNPLFQQAFEFIQNNDLSKMELGKTIINGDKLYISVMENEGKTPEAAKMETHRNYIDIQVIISGAETMGWTAIEHCTDALEPYNEEKDLQFFANKPSAYVTVNPGEFAIFFPEDGHAPGIGNGPIKKAVVKVLA